MRGRLTADPEYRQTPGGVSVATFCVASDRNYQQKDSEKKLTDFIHCVVWRQTADFVSQYFTKGKMVALEGSLQSRNYEDKSGNRRTAYEVIAERVYFADSGRRENPPEPGDMDAPPDYSERDADSAPWMEQGEI